MTPTVERILPVALNPDDELATLDLADIGWRIRALRTSRGWSQADVADACGAERVTVSRWETGRYQPTMTHFLRLSDAFRCTLDYLILGRG